MTPTAAAAASSDDDRLSPRDEARTAAADAVERAELPVLVAALVQATGDRSLLDRAQSGLGDPRQPPSGETLAEVRAHALVLLDAVLAAPSRRPADLTDDEMCRLMALCAGEDVPAAYLPLVREESNFDGTDLRRFEWSRHRAPQNAGGFRVGVIGAGLGGVCAGVRLQQAGLDYTILEKNDAIGGTWFENDYPDLRVDVPNHFYSYSFEPNPEWSDHYARRAEIDAYIERCADKYGVRPHVRLGTEVLSARWDERSATWSVRTRRRDGSEEPFAFNALVSAVGMLNRPMVPDLDGLESFEGPWFHSSHWDHQLDLTGLRVGVIGTGASAVQFVPAIAPDVGHLTVFQRSRHWVLPNPKYRSSVSEEEKWLFRNVPFYAAWYRFLLFWQNGDRLFPAFCVDPAWEDQSRSISPASDKLRRRATRYVLDQLGPDNELVDRVLPDYPPFGKRILQDNGWYRTLLRENVSLATDPIDRLTPRGVVTASGEHHELDVLILATGFHANKFLWPIEIVGRHGRTLHDLWGDSPRAHLGITVPGFPNLFCIYGPNTNPVVGSVIFMLECQVRYIMNCLRALVEDGYAAMDCRQDVHDEYNRRVDAAHEQMVWRHPRVHSYYNNQAGRVTTNVPWRLIDYWQMTLAPNLADFELVPSRDSTTGAGTV